jgi:hypothetical protein
MTTKFTTEQLADCLEHIKDAAEEDTSFSFAEFEETSNEPFCIVAGWSERFSDNSEVDDLFCCSKSHPRYVMCVKIAENENPRLALDYEFMNMPIDPLTKEVYDTEIMLEWDDPVDYVAEFFMHEWETLMTKAGYEI